MSVQIISADWAAISDEQVMTAVKAGSVSAGLQRLRVDIQR
jgi:hypothetical protein